MKNPRHLLKNRIQIGLVLLIAGVLALLTWGNYRFSVQNPGGNDFLVHWMGTRSFVVDGLSPYSDETAIRIQTAAYGRPAQAGEHELRVAYPLYSMIIFLPYALVEDFNLARALWMTTLEVALLLLSYLCMRLTRWKPGLPTLGAFFLFSVLWYHAVRPLVNGNAVILIALGFVAGFLALRNHMDELAAVLFALTTIKPHLVLILLVFLIFWAWWHERRKFSYWFIASLFVLSAVSALFIPDWIIQNLREVIRYPAYNPPGTLREALQVLLPSAGERIGWAITVILGVVLLLEWWLFRDCNFREFNWVASLTLVIGQWVGIQTDPGNFIILLPALVLAMKIWEERWRRMGVMLSFGSMLTLLVGIWALFLATVEGGEQPQQSPVMFLPLPAFLLLMLYWVRWWVVKPPQMWYEKVLAEENPDD